MKWWLTKLNQLEPNSNATGMQRNGARRWVLPYAELRRFGYSRFPNLKFGLDQSVSDGATGDTGTIVFIHGDDHIVPDRVGLAGSRG